MKLTKKQIENIIKEEIRGMLEADFPPNPFKDRTPSMHPEVKKALENAAGAIISHHADKEEAILQLKAMLSSSKDVLGPGMTDDEIQDLTDLQQRMQADALAKQGVK